jgi:methenyltetrahydromethanopterin cyclohydrolase
VISVNRNALEIVSETIRKAEDLNIQVSKTSNGATVIDMGVNAPGGWDAALKFVDISLGGLGKSSFGLTRIKDHDLPVIRVFTDHPLISCLCSQISGWVLRGAEGPDGIAPLGSGPARAIARQDMFIKDFDYADKSDKVVLLLQIDRLPDENIAKVVAEGCGVSPENVYLLAARTGSVVGSTNVSSRTLETSIWRLHVLGFDLNNVISAWGEAPVAPFCDDELTAMVRVNTFTYYGGSAGFVVDGDDDELSRIVRSMPLSPETCADYHVGFAELFERADRDIFKMEGFVHSVARVTIYNARTGSVFSAGEVDENILDAVLKWRPK